MKDVKWLRFSGLPHQLYKFKIIFGYSRKDIKSQGCHSAFIKINEEHVYREMNSC